MREFAARTRIPASTVPIHGAAHTANAPPRKGFGLLAWWLPIAGIVIVGALLGVGAWRWSRARPEEPAVDPSLNGRGALDPAIERRVDEELARFDG